MKERRIMFAALEGYSTEYLRLHNKVKPYYIVAKQYDNQDVLLEDVSAEGFLKQLEELKGNTTVYFKNGGDYLHYLISPIFKLYKRKDIKVSMSDTNKIYEIRISYKRRIDGVSKQYTHKLIGVESIWPLEINGMAESVDMKTLASDKYNFTDEFETVEEFKSFNDGKNYDANNRDVDILIAFAQQTWSFIEMNEYSQTLAATSMKMWRNTNSEDSKGMNLWMRYKDEEGNWQQDDELWKTIKRAHKGGFVYAKPEHQLEMLENVYDYDINSMYSNTMLNEKLPYGYPNYNDEEEYTYKVYKVIIRKAVAKTVPFIATEYNTMQRAEMLEQSLNGNGEIISKENEYQKELINMEVVMNNYMLELFKENYTELDYDVKFVVNFKEKYGMFNRFLEEILEMKENAVGAERELIKGVLNSITGKFSQNIMDKSVELVREEDLLEPIKTNRNGEKTYNGQRVSVNDGIVFIKKNNGIKNNISYIPLGEAITSKSKIRLIKDIVNNWDNFVYCDTDGFMTIGPAKGLEIDNDKIGKYKFQGRWNKVVVRRPKHYACQGLIEDKNGMKEVVEGYQLKGGGFQVKNFNENNLPLSVYIEPQFKVNDGTLNKLVVNGGVVFWNSKFTFDMPSAWVMKQYEMTNKDKELVKRIQDNQQQKFNEEMDELMEQHRKEVEREKLMAVKKWIEQEKKEWDVINQEWVVKTYRKEI